MNSVVKVIFIIFILQHKLTYIKCQNGINTVLRLTEDEVNDFAVLILDILINTLIPYKCIALITDDVYYGVLTDSLFKKFDIYLSYFVIYVTESEDLLSPYPGTQESLKIIKKHGCQTYVILLANGLQVSRLLRYGERYRILDTRAKFILLHDNRLFQKHLYYLWKRIVNVVFLKEYIGIKRTPRGVVNIPWFELSTVPFPSPLQNIFVPRRLDIWRKSKFRTGVNLFQDKTRDLRNQTMKVVVMKHTPATIKLPVNEDRAVTAVVGEGQVGFAGVEVEILTAVSKAMNFKCEFYEAKAPEADFWGKKEPGGKYTGLIGEMVLNHADIALGDLYYTSYVLELMDLTVPYNTECLTFLTPESSTDNSWKTLTLPFKLVMWIGVMICLLLCSIIFHYLARFHFNIQEDVQKTQEDTKIDLGKKKREVITLPMISIDRLNPNSKYVLMKQHIKATKRDREPNGLYLFSDFFNSMLYTYGMILMVPLPRLPTGWSLRMLTGWYWLYCTLVVVSYRASMTAILANPAPRVAINTLEELVDSKLALGGWGEVHRELFKTSLDPITQTIGTNFEFVNDSEESIARVCKGRFALYENTYFLKEAAVLHQARPRNTYDDNRSAPFENQRDRNLHIMNDCVINMPVSIGLQKNSPIKPRADRYIREILEAGLIKKWLDDVMQSSLNSEAPTTLETTKALMSMRKFIGAIVALSVGYVISIVVFTIEIAYFYYAVKKHPNFNKYSRKIHKK